MFSLSLSRTWPGRNHRDWSRNGQPQLKLLHERLLTFWGGEFCGISPELPLTVFAARERSLCGGKQRQEMGRGRSLITLFEYLDPIVPEAIYPCISYRINLYFDLRQFELYLFQLQLNFRRLI